MFHRLEHRIRAYVLICWLPLLLAERAIYQAPSVEPPIQAIAFDPT